MKRQLLLGMLTLLVLLGCSNPPQASTGEDRYGNPYRESGYGLRVYTVDALPCRMVYDDVGIELLSLDIYQEQGEHGHYYHVIVAVDLCELDEDEALQGPPKGDFSVACYLNSEKNDHSELLINTVPTFIIDQKAYIVYTLLGDEFRYDLDDVILTLNIELKQDNFMEFMFQGKPETVRETYRYSYTKELAAVPDGIDTAEPAVVDEIYAFYESVLALYQK